ncbi:hypothetical protein GAYE_SCF7681MG6996 [Galdieria yellowstonensis]|uniref:Uncharacterized protein n=1 Tax=Galdieria yellowstonensis TaxID=3028027 RepID=A0AAV9INR6_9RHOD|nr:hypothetical protein GAYE_SCF7681MG6996 [Galdieria yellowstonensis]
MLTSKQKIKIFSRVCAMASFEAFLQEGSEPTPLRGDDAQHTSEEFHRTFSREIKNLPSSKKIQNLLAFWKLSLVFSYVATLQQKSAIITTLWRANERNGMAEM